MEFCTKCGGLITIQVGRKTGICAKCGARATVETKVIKEKIRHPKKKTIRKKSEQIETLPVVKAVCPKCGHSKAYWWTQLVQEESEDADISEVNVYRCAKCNHIWRET